MGTFEFGPPRTTPSAFWNAGRIALWRAVSHCTQRERGLLCFYSIESVCRACKQDRLRTAVTFASHLELRHGASLGRDLASRSSQARNLCCDMKIENSRCESETTCVSIGHTPHTSMHAVATSPLLTNTHEPRKTDKENVALSSSDATRRSQRTEWLTSRVRNASSGPAALSATACVRKTYPRQTRLRGKHTLAVSAHGQREADASTSDATFAFPSDIIDCEIELLGRFLEPSAVVILFIHLAQPRPLFIRDVEEE